MIVDIAIAILVLEAIIYTLTPLHKDRNLLWLALTNGAAGLCLLLALRAALHGADPGWILFALSAALIAHLIDLALRRQLESRSFGPAESRYGHG